MRVLTLDHVLELARRRRLERERLLRDVRAQLRTWATESVELEPFEHGTFIDQLRFELNTLRIEHGDPLAAARRQRRNKKIKTKIRRLVYIRDDYTCQDCGWRSPRDADERKKENQSGRFLTIDHVIPQAEGGPNHHTNMRTLCSWCNPAKGKRLPDAVPEVA